MKRNTLVDQHMYRQLIQLLWGPWKERESSWLVPSPLVWWERVRAPFYLWTAFFEKKVHESLKGQGGGFKHFVMGPFSPDVQSWTCRLVLYKPSKFSISSLSGLVWPLFPLTMFQATCFFSNLFLPWPFDTLPGTPGPDCLLCLAMLLPCFLDLSAYYL